MGKHYSEDFKNPVLKDYMEGTYGVICNLAKNYNISEYTRISKDYRKLND